ncbi:MAG: 4Fe-4S cluster-binding domain-containing protein [Oscillospiraceae bacterium]
MTEGVICNLCPRLCGALRTPTKGDGVCHCGTVPIVARAAAHFGEEPCISGVRGSGTVFFSGCSLRCVFCQNSKISRFPFGKSIEETNLRDIFERLEQLGVHNINLVSPSHFASSISRALEKPLSIPVIWNSSGYDNVETLRSLEGKIQIFLPDMKYSDNALALCLSGAGDYFECAKKAIAEMFRQTGRYRLDSDGILCSGLVVRHLALPSHMRNTRGVIDWFSSTFHDGDAMFSLMTQYTPLGDLRAFPEIDRPLSRRECALLERCLFNSGISDGFIQERCSAGCELIPDFDLTGV